MLLGTTHCCWWRYYPRIWLAQRIPSVLKEDVYALPSIIGGIVYYLMVTSSWDSMAVYGAFTVVLVIRLLALKYNWSLPKVGKPSRLRNNSQMI